MAQNFKTSPPSFPSFLISYPAPTIILITINRPKSQNAFRIRDHLALNAIFNCSTFCAGADLKEWKQNIDSGISVTESLPPTGFGGLSRRAGKKPIIAAVNGICFGGGFEMVINADLVIADEVAKFALPEVKIGVAAIEGGLTRLVRTVGKQRAMEICLTGRTLSAGELKDWGILNKVVKNGECVNEAIKTALLISKNGPEGVICSKEGVNLGWEGLSAEEGTKALLKGTFTRINNGENMAEGVNSFLEKRKPIWIPSKI